MKKNILLIAVIAAAVFIELPACNRDFTLKSPVALTDGSSFLRIMDLSPNFRKIFGFPDSFNVIVNGAKISGFTPGGTYLMTFGASFPTVSTSFGYVAVPSGSQAIKLSTGSALTGDSIAIVILNTTFLPNQSYTFLITDSVGVFVPDIYTPPTTGYFNLRFIHAVLNDTAGKTIDVWSTRSNKNIFTNIKPGAITSFTQYPYNSLLNDTLYVRRSGSTAITLDTLNAVSFSNQRTYTLYYKGDATANLASTTAKRRHLATYVHQ